MHTATTPLLDLPKAHLHLHLVGAMRRPTFHEWLRHRQAPPPAISPRLTQREFARHYDLATTLVSSRAHLARLVDEIVADQAADGVWWVEITADPLLYRGALGSPADTVALCLDAGRTAARRYGVGVGWILCANRASVPGARHVATLAAEAATEGVVGFGLAGDELRAGPRTFAPAFAIAAEAGLVLCPHAGERRGPGDVAEALDHLAPHRLGHALGAAQDPALLTAIADRGICIEACPTSNVALGLTRSLRVHPLPAMLAAGVPVALGADDPLLFGDTLTDVYRSVAAAFGFGLPEMAALALTAFERSAAPLPLRRRAAQAIRSWVARKPRDVALSA